MILLVVENIEQSLYFLGREIPLSARGHSSDIQSRLVPDRTVDHVQDCGDTVDIDVRDVGYCLAVDNSGVYDAIEIDVVESNAVTEVLGVGFHYLPWKQLVVFSPDLAIHHIVAYAFPEVFDYGAVIDGLLGIVAVVSAWVFGHILADPVSSVRV